MADFAPLGSLDPHYIALGYFSSNLKENIVIIKKSSIPFDRRNKTYPGANTYNPHNNETQYVRVRASVSKSIDSEHRQVYLSPSHAPIHERTWQVYSRQYDCCHGGRDLPQDDWWWNWSRYFGPNSKLLKRQSTRAMKLPVKSSERKQTTTNRVAIIRCQNSAPTRSGEMHATTQGKYLRRRTTLSQHMAVTTWSIDIIF